jgi:hypothetical protein
MASAGQARCLLLFLRPLLLHLLYLEAFDFHSQIACKFMILESEYEFELYVLLGEEGIATRKAVGRSLLISFNIAIRLER